MQTIQINFKSSSTGSTFLSTFTLPPSPQLQPTVLQQIQLFDRYAGIGLLPLSAMATSAFTAALRNMVFEIISRAPPSSHVHSIPFLPCLPFEIALSEAWADATSTQWDRDSFLALSPIHLQQKLFGTKSKALFDQLLRNSSDSDVIRLHSCAAIGAAAFLSTPQTIPGCAFSNIEFTTAIRLRLGLPLGIPLPPPVLVEILLTYKELISLNAISEGNGSPGMTP